MLEVPATKFVKNVGQIQKTGTTGGHSDHQSWPNKWIFHDFKVGL